MWMDGSSPIRTLHPYWENVFATAQVTEGLAEKRAPVSEILGFIKTVSFLRQNFSRPPRRLIVSLTLLRIVDATAWGCTLTRASRDLAMLASYLVLLFFRGKLVKEKALFQRLLPFHTDKEVLESILS